MKERIRNLIRDIPDFPKKGIVFKDITTVLKDARAFRHVVDDLASRFRKEKVTSVICVEARGFILGSAVAYALGASCVPVRKKGKLPYKTYQASYALEYGEDVLEIHRDALKEGEVVLVVDDLLATGGTISAVVDLLKKFKARIVGLAFVVELSFLKGRDKLESHPIYSIVQYS